MILRNPQFLLLLALLPILALVWRARGGRVQSWALALRLLMVSLVIVALADPVAVRRATGQGPLVVLVDQSDSLGEEGKATLRDQATALLDARAGQTHLLSFGANPGQPLSADQTDIAAALQAARGMIGAGGGRVLLLSDGAQTRGDALGAARMLAADGIPIDTLAYLPPDRPEIWIAGVDVPHTLRAGEEYTVDIVVASTEAGTARLELREGRQILASGEVRLAPGENHFPYPARAGEPGIVALQATIVGQPDTFERNNSASATALVAPAPRVLLVESIAGAAEPLRAALRLAGILAETIVAAEVPAQLPDLAAYEGIVLVDVSAGDLTLDQMAALREFVRSEGRGLIVAGGRASFTLGAYKDTPLEEVMPVLMTPPPRPSRPEVTLLLILDQSASMDSSTHPSKLDMAKEAAILATEELREEDRIGVLAFDTAQQWVVEFQRLGAGLSLAEIQERIAMLPSGGGTDIYAALEVGLDALANEPGQVRHVVLLTDGRSFTTERGPYRAVVEQARARNITLSAIAIGADADTELLQDLAQWGAGRYHFAGEAEEIPRLTLQESEIARTTPQVEGDFRAELAAPHPLLRDFAPNQIPPLQGYVATTIKPQAELVLRSPEDDPVLAVWQYGLGRAVAWTPSIEAPWANAWSNWPEYGAFWAQIIRYALPEPDSGPLQVRVTPQGDSVIISADSLAASGKPLDLANTETTITLPDGSAHRIALRQTAPGHYQAAVRLPIDGPYAIEVRQRKGADERNASVGYARRYSDEYLPAPLAGGAALLEQISAVSGGNLLTSLAGLEAPASGPTATAQGMWMWLLLAAALLWPIEIALRRGWLGWRRAGF